MTARLTRRERVAMELALEVLRSEPLEAEPALTERVARRRGGYVRRITPLWQRAGEARR